MNFKINIIWRNDSYMSNKENRNFQVVKLLHILQQYKNNNEYFELRMRLSTKSHISKSSCTRVFRILTVINNELINLSTLTHYGHRYLIDLSTLTHNLLIDLSTVTHRYLTNLSKLTHIYLINFKILYYRYLRDL